MLKLICLSAYKSILDFATIVVLVGNARKYMMKHGIIYETFFQHATSGRRRVHCTWREEVSRYLIFSEHYSDVIMITMASQITSLTIEVQIKENIKAPRHWPLCGEFIGDRWSPRTKRPVTRKMIPFDDVIMKSMLHGNIVRSIVRINNLTLFEQLFFHLI